MRFIKALHRIKNNRDQYAKAAFIVFLLYIYIIFNYGKVGNYENTK